MYFVGWEFFHRGFLTIGLQRVFGWYAVFVVLADAYELAYDALPPQYIPPRVAVPSDAD